MAAARESEPEVRERLVHCAGNAVWRLTDDRVVSRRRRSTAAGTTLFADKAGIVCLALDIFELPLDRSLIADKHQAPAMSGGRFSGFHLRAKRDAGADDPVPLNLRLVAGVVAGVDFPNVRRVWAFALLGIVAELEVIVVFLIVTQRRLVVERGAFKRSTAFPAAEHPGAEQLWIHTQPWGLLPNQLTKLWHFLLEAPEHHVRAVAHPGRRHFRRWAFLMRIFGVLPRVTKHKLSRPQQILARQPLIGAAPRV